MDVSSPTKFKSSYVWKNYTKNSLKFSHRINFASVDRFKNVGRDVHFILTSIKTVDNFNEFSFRLHLKQNPDPSQGDYFELKGSAKVPTAQEWSFKIKTEPPVFLVSKQNFLSDYPGARIPKEIADKPFIGYELHIDKCRPMRATFEKVKSLTVHS